MINVGCGEDLSIRDLATLVQRVVGHEGPMVWDASLPDGTPRKLMDVSRLRALGWQPTIGLEDGVRATYEWYLGNLASQEGRVV
jgi:GDP-L-fucose synthase